MRSFSLLYAYPVGKKALESKDQRKTNGEGRMLRFMTESIHAGETADASRQQWWCLTKGGESVNTSADQTPIADGDVFELTLTEGY